MGRRKKTRFSGSYQLGTGTASQIKGVAGAIRRSLISRGRLSQEYSEGGFQGTQHLRRGVCQTRKYRRCSWEHKKKVGDGKKSPGQTRVKTVTP